MIPEFWTTRDEAFLAAILGESVELPVPQTRLELFLAKIAGMSVETPEPQTRAEIYLAAILGANVALPVPLSRVDLYLAKVAGMDVETPEPLTRIDAYLAEWAENGSGEIVTVSGTSPLVLANAMAHAIRKLVQYGKCTTVDGDIYCNNGKLVAVDDELPTGYKRLLGITFDGSFRYETGEHLTGADDVTMTLDNLSSSGKNVFGSYNGANDKNFSLYIYGSSTSGSYFRYGDQLKRPKYGGTGRRTITFGASGTSGFAEDSTVDPDTFTTPDNVYIGMLPNSSSPGYTGDIVGDILVGTRLKWIPVERESDGVIGYYERVKGNFIAPSGSGTPVSLGYDASHLNVLSVVGTPEVLTIGSQTASVENLFEVNGVADEQDIISGVITRKVGVNVSAGVITLSALATPVTEQTTPQPLSTTEGTNTVSWTAEVSGTVKEVKYAYEAPSFEWKTASGAVVSVNDAIEGEVGALTVGINPVQDLHGYSNPWPAGGGKNKLPVTVTSETVNGVAFTVYADGTVLMNGTASDLTVFTLNANFRSNLVNGTSYILSGSPTNTDTSKWKFRIYNGADYVDTGSGKSFTYSESPIDCKVDIVVYSGTTVSNILIKPMIRLATNSDSSFAPYSNVCPISGWTQIDVWVQPTYDTSANPSATIPLGGTYYGGTLDVLTGVLTVTKAFIDSYAGESIGEPWLSSMDKYVSGTTPTTGAQVVYTLATPQTVQLTPAQVSTLLGTNVIWASGNGEVSVTYRAEVSE